MVRSERESGIMGMFSDDAPSQEEIDAAIETLARTMRYSVRDNELEDWIA